MAGLTHSIDGTVQVWVDGAATGDGGSADYGSARAWSRLGGALDDAYYGRTRGFAGSLAASDRACRSRRCGNGRAYPRVGTLGVSTVP
jgi:hypothetical protein